MTDSLIRYLVDQASGVVIAIMLIWQVGSKLDSINQSISELTRSLISKIK